MIDHLFSFYPVKHDFGVRVPYLLLSSEDLSQTLHLAAYLRRKLHRIRQVLDEAHNLVVFLVKDFHIGVCGHLTRLIDLDSDLDGAKKRLESRKEQLAKASNIEEKDRATAKVVETKGEIRPLEKRLNKLQMRVKEIAALRTGVRELGAMLANAEKAFEKLPPVEVLDPWGRTVAKVQLRYKHKRSK